MSDLEEVEKYEGYVWAMFYASIVSMERHPGRGRAGGAVLNLQQCAAIADEMITEFYFRFPIKE